MARTKSTTAGTEKTAKPELFVASSGETARLTSAVAQLLQHQFNVTPWTAGVFEPSSTALADLVRQLDKSAYGVFIFAKDDRVRSRGKEYQAARDNVLFELGLFMGRLGPENCYILVPKDKKKLKIPSDLEGFGTVSYDEDRVDDNPQAALNPACTAITEAIARRRKDAPPVPASETSVSLTPPKAPPASLETRLRSDLHDLLGMVHRGDAGVEIAQREPDRFVLWAKNALHLARLALQSVTPTLPADAYVAWLRPTDSDREHLSFFLGDNTAADFASTHHPFSLGEGLAGTVWAALQPASHSPAQPHPKWRPRADCTNESYVCVAVGKPAGSGGVLGFGSDQGFDIRPEQITILEVFASILGAVVPVGSWWQPEKPGRLRRRT
jgi:predicted nucleotide-binding protein